jgi:hypothetical protein
MTAGNELMLVNPVRIGPCNEMNTGRHLCLVCNKRRIGEDEEREREAVTDGTQVNFHM